MQMTPSQQVGLISVVVGVVGIISTILILALWLLFFVMNHLARWSEFKIRKLEVIRKQYQEQVKVLTEEISDIDYEIGILTELIEENVFWDIPQ